MASVESRQEIEQVHTLLQQYFEVGNCEIDRVIAGWLQSMEVAWIHAAVMEALYQGRYKLVSVDQILRLWQRRGNPLRHFNREFESIISGHSTLFPNTWAAAENTLLRAASHPQSFYRPAPVVPSGSLAADSPAPSRPSDPHPSVPLAAAEAEAPSPSTPQPMPVEAPAVTMLPAEGTVQEDKTALGLTDGPTDELANIWHPEAIPEPPKAAIQGAVKGPMQGFKDEAEGMEAAALGLEESPIAAIAQLNIFDPAAFITSECDTLAPEAALIPDVHSLHHPDPIKPFIPEVETSELYHRLQEVARRSANV